VEKCGRARQTTGDDIMLPRKDAICMPDNEGKNMDTHSQYVILVTFLRQQWLWEWASCLSCNIIVLSMPMSLFRFPVRHPMHFMYLMQGNWRNVRKARLDRVWAVCGWHCRLGCAYTLAQYHARIKYVFNDFRCCTVHVASTISLIFQLMHTHTHTHYIQFKKALKFTLTL